MMVSTLLGGVLGAVLLVKTPTRVFDAVLPWLLLVAALALGFGRQLGEVLRRRWSIRPWAVMTVQFALGVYGGFFGGAVGIMMMAVWGLLECRELKSLNAPRTLMVSTANSVAVVIFVLARVVRWPETLAMLMGAALGGYLGAQVGRRAPARIVRFGTLALTGCITLAFFMRAYR